NDQDPFNFFGIGSTPATIVMGPSGTYPTSNTQVDNAVNGIVGSSVHGVYQSIDVRLTQLRNLLAGTRPQPNRFAPDPTGTVNGDANAVYGSFPGQVGQTPYLLPNGIADLMDYPHDNTGFLAPLHTYQFADPSGTGTDTAPLVQRTSPPVGGRWGEA